MVYKILSSAVLYIFLKYCIGYLLRKNACCEPLTIMCVHQPKPAALVAHIFFILLQSHIYL